VLLSQNQVISSVLNQNDSIFSKKITGGKGFELK
jgi:hypothetical protein